ncbi:hypothetical protein C8J56DRAFT_896635 [Mycena floridula]|nr:hypothetical protein C8J56DRAFT_896635 [Mycena floridula]
MATQATGRHGHSAAKAVSQLPEPVTTKPQQASKKSAAAGASQKRTRGPETEDPSMTNDPAPPTKRSKSTAVDQATSRSPSRPKRQNRNTDPACLVKPCPKRTPAMLTAAIKLKEKSHQPKSFDRLSDMDVDDEVENPDDKSFQMEETGSDSDDDSEVDVDDGSDMDIDDGSQEEPEALKKKKKNNVASHMMKKTNVKDKRLAPVASGLVANWKDKATGGNGCKKHLKHNEPVLGGFDDSDVFAQSPNLKIGAAAKLNKAKSKLGAILTGLLITDNDSDHGADIASEPELPTKSRCPKPCPATVNAAKKASASKGNNQASAAAPKGTKKASTVISKEFSIKKWKKKFLLTLFNALYASGNPWEEFGSDNSMLISYLSWLSAALYSLDEARCGSEYSLSTDGGLSGKRSTGFPVSQWFNIQLRLSNALLEACSGSQLWIQFLMHKLDEESHQGMTCTLRHIRDLSHVIIWGQKGTWSDEYDSEFHHLFYGQDVEFPQYPLTIERRTQTDMYGIRLTFANNRSAITFSMLWNRAGPWERDFLLLARVQDQE